MDGASSCGVVLGWRGLHHDQEWPGNGHLPGDQAISPCPPYREGFAGPERLPRGPPAGQSAARAARLRGRRRVEQQQPVGVVVREVAQQEQRGVGAAPSSTCDPAERARSRRRRSRSRCSACHAACAGSCGLRRKWHCQNVAAASGARATRTRPVRAGARILQEVPSSLRHIVAQRQRVIGEVHEGCRDPNSWPWNSIGMAGSSRTARHRAQVGRRASRRAVVPIRVGDLVVVLEEVMQVLRGRRRPGVPRAAFCHVVLALEERAPARAGEPFAGDAPVVGEVGLCVPRGPCGEWCESSLYRASGPSRPPRPGARRACLGSSRPSQHAPAAGASRAVRQAATRCSGDASKICCASRRSPSMWNSCTQYATLRGPSRAPVRCGARRSSARHPIRCRNGP